MFVKIEWSDKCAREGDLKITKKTTKKDETESELTRWWSLARGFISLLGERILAIVKIHQS